MTRQLEPRPKITIGLCVKNSERTIRKCLDSIINQDYPIGLIEIIIVDGGSEDKTLEIARNILSDQRVVSKFFLDHGKGLGFARQIVLDNTGDKYVVWVDSDVTISKNFVRNMVEFMEEHPMVGVAVGKSVYQLNEPFTLPASLQNLTKYIGSAEFKQTKKYRGLPPNDASVYRVEAAKKVGGFDINIRGASEDEDIIWRITKRKWSVTVNEKARFHAVPRSTWQSLWHESSWFGYGTHFLHHKHGEFHKSKKVPLIFFVGGIRAGVKAYKATFKKSAFLLPIYYVFLNMAWWSGFIKAHMEDYGHEKN